MGKNHKNNPYRKIYEEHHGKIPKGYHIHHIDGNPWNNDINNLECLTEKEHNEKHKGDFVLWASRGAKLGNEAFKKRLKEQGPTKKELEYKKIRIENCKKGLHRVPHTEATKQLISDKKKEHLKDKTKHPMWGKNTYKIISPTGEQYIISGGFTQWCKDRGLNNSNLRYRGQSKGWTAELYNVNNRKS